MSATGPFRTLAIGFIAGALAVVTVHQAFIFGLIGSGLLPATSRAWNLQAYGPLQVPAVINVMFWGGLWGALFGVVWHKLPGGAMWLRGLVYGVLITLFSNWTLLPLVRHHLFGITNPAQIHLFNGWDPKRMAVVLAIQIVYGIGLASIWSLLARQR